VTSDDHAGAPQSRWAWAAIDVAAVAHNVSVLAAAVDPAEVWAVVKAGGYGHGAERVARAAIGAGATGLCVALVEEGLELRRSGIEVPILVLTQQPEGQLADLVAARLTATAYERSYVAALADAVRDAGAAPVPVHLKVDTGMHRVGAHPDDAVAVAEAVLDRSPLLALDGVFTHLACADEPSHPATAAQLACFAQVVEALRGSRAGQHRWKVHAANSAAALAHPAARFDLVRAGIALYGITPGPGVAEHCAQLRPAMRLVSRVSFVKRLEAGAGVSYGWRSILSRATTVATVPLGYADGVPRRLSPASPGPASPGQVLIGGRRRPILGVVTMDQLLVDCGDDDVSVGDEVVLLGVQGEERIRVEEWAERLGTIGYEVVCGISQRIPRRDLGDGQ
jgi:alanine racemase